MDAEVPNPNPMSGWSVGGSTVCWSAGCYSVLLGHKFSARKIHHFPAKVLQYRITTYKYYIHNSKVSYSTITLYSLINLDLFREAGRRNVPQNNNLHQRGPQTVDRRGRNTSQKMTRLEDIAFARRRTQYAKELRIALLRSCQKE